MNFKYLFLRIKKPLELIFIRGVGSLIYSVVAVACIPSQYFSDVVTILPLMEFISAMLFPVMRTGIISNRITSGIGLVLMLTISSMFFIYVMLTSVVELKYLIPACIVFAFVPFAVIASAYYEKISVKKSTSHEVRVAFSSALGASLLIYISNIGFLPDYFNNPLLRSALFPVVFLIGADFSGLRRFIAWGDFKAVNTLLSLRGLDYLMLLSFIKINLLGLLRDNPFGDFLVKVFIVIYDISSALLSYFLRHRYSTSKFQFSVYVRSTFSVFIALVVASFVIVAIGAVMHHLDVRFYSFLYMMGACVLILLMAGMTTTVILVNLRDYLLLIISLFLGFCFVGSFLRLEGQLLSYGFTMVIFLIRCYFLNSARNI